MRFLCKTFFDITATGVTGHYKSSRIPFNDKSGNIISNENTWNHARNQQRNWETITQILSLRTQIFDITFPVSNENLWTFEFEVETPGVFGPTNSPTEMLLTDADGVPMLLGLKNKSELEPILITNGNNQNIWFECLP
jgi:hypothetical protein